MSPRSWSNTRMSEPASQRPTRVVVDLGALTHNLGAIRERVRVPVMGIVKANAYGHGLVPVARHLEARGVDQLGVAFLEEGIALRRAGLKLPILVLGAIFGPQVAEFIRHDLDITVSSLDKLRQVEAAVASQWIAIKGIYSHLACADDPSSPMTALQVKRFAEACAHFERLGAPPPPRHLANSGGVLHFPDTWLDMVRPGIVLYGVLPDPASQRTIAVRPALSLVSQVVYFKVVRAGNTVSYGATWTAERDTRIVTIPIGYGDGWPRALSSKGEVLVRGNRMPIVGRICMDQFMVDLGADGTAWNEDEVVLVGAQGGAAISAEDVALLAGTIPYEILTGLNERIPRVYR